VFTDFFKQNAKWIGAVAALLAFNVATFLLFAQPKLNHEAIQREQWQRISALQEETRVQMNRLLDDLRVVRDQNANLNRFYTEILGTRARQLDELLEETERLGRRHGVLPVQVRYSGAEVRGQPLEHFSMGFPLVGNYASLRFFINALERSDMFFIIDSVELAEPRQGEELEMRISVVTYFHRPMAREEEEL